MKPTFAAQSLDELGIDDAEIEAKFLLHLRAPLLLKGRRAQHQHGAGTMAQKHFLNHQASLDRLPEADVVCDEQTSAGHVDGSDQWV